METWAIYWFYIFITKHSSLGHREIQILKLHVSWEWHCVFLKALKQHLMRKSWARTVTKGPVDGNIKKVFWQAWYFVYSLFFFLHFFLKFAIDVDFKHYSTEKMWSCNAGEGYCIIYVLCMKLKCEHGYFNLVSPSKVVSQFVCRINALPTL